MDCSTISPQKEILIVEDTRDLLELFSHILSSKGYQVRPFLFGKPALNSARMRPPDLILLDITMPDISGYDICKQLKADPRTQMIPIIFCSALDDESIRNQAFAVGGTAYLTKPIPLDELLTCVSSQLSPI